MVGLPDFGSHSKSRPLETQPLFDHSKSRLVRISDPTELYSDPGSKCGTHMCVLFK